MLAELNLRKARLESLQHELMCSRAALESPVVFLLLPQNPIVLMRLLPHRSTSLTHTGGQEDIRVQSMEQGYQEVNCESTCQLSEFIAEEVHAASEAGAFCAIFVGTLPKMYHGVKRAEWQLCMPLVY